MRSMTVADVILDWTTSTLWKHIETVLGMFVTVVFVSFMTMSL
jgi:hypothetical protein